MNYLYKLILSGLAVIVLAEFLPNVSIDNYLTALFVAFILSVLNILVKPILVILTLPITIVTLGLFLLIINAIIILLADFLIDGFSVDGLFWAFVFSLLLSFLQSILNSFLKKEKK